MDTKTKTMKRKDGECVRVAGQGGCWQILQNKRVQSELVHQIVKVNHPVLFSSFVKNVGWHESYFFYKHTRVGKKESQWHKKGEAKEVLILLCELIAEVLDIKHMWSCFSLELPLFTVCIEDSMAKEFIHSHTKVWPFDIVLKVVYRGKERSCINQIPMFFPVGNLLFRTCSTFAGWIEKIMWGIQMALSELEKRVWVLFFVCANGWWIRLTRWWHQAHWILRLRFHGGEWSNGQKKESFQVTAKQKAPFLSFLWRDCDRCKS